MLSIRLWLGAVAMVVSATTIAAAQPSTWSPPALGARWVTLSDDEVERSTYDTASVARPLPHQLAVWVRHDMRRLTADNAADWNTGVRTRMVRFVIDCDLRSVALTDATWFDQDGRSLRSASYNVEWSAILPESGGERIVIALCPQRVQRARLPKAR